MPLHPLPVLQQQISECTRCPRLREYCEQVAREKKRAHRDELYWGRPVPGFGDPDARVWIVGLAPAAHGANRTGRVFTGDSSGHFLMRALHRAGFASIPSSTHAADGLRLTGAFISAAARCAPPDNKPLPLELDACFPWLRAEFAALRRARVIVALGRVAFDACLRLLGERGALVRPRPAFGHGALHAFGPDLPTLVASYHPSRQNTNTGRLTEPMFDEVFRLARRCAPLPATSIREV
ncbi:MAG TPA: uracil-DNA glycosylase [Vicinamibacterales bacterium]|nr:uracil-DNA glycosylase [Vicinamibacterales bacterium]